MDYLEQQRPWGEMEKKKNLHIRLGFNTAESHHLRPHTRTQVDFEN